MLKRILKIAIISISTNKLRTILTTLGIIIGTAIVIIVLSVGAGFKNIVLGQLSSITEETLYIEIQVPFEGTRAEIDANTAETLTSGAEITTMTLQDVDDALKHYNIEKGYGLTIGQGKFTYKSNEKIANLWATSSDYQYLDDLQFSEGRFFTDSEDKSLSQVVVLGSSIAKTLFANESPVGKNIKLDNQNFKVIGLMEEVGTKYFLEFDDFVFVPVRTAQKKILGINHILAVGLEMKDKSLIESTIFDLTKMFRRNHNIKDPSKDDFVFRTLDESVEIVSGITSGVNYLLLSLELISLVVGGVGIMNIMYVTVTERTTEIGLRKAVGAKPALIKLQFLLEAVILTFVGALIGLVFGAVMVFLISLLAEYLNFEWQFIIELNAIILAFTIAFIIGIAFGYGPAKKASQLNPIDALRSV